MDQYQGWSIYSKSNAILPKCHSMFLFGHIQYSLLFLHLVEVLRLVKYEQLSQSPEELFRVYLSKSVSLKLKLYSSHGS